MRLKMTEAGSNREIDVYVEEDGTFEASYWVQVFQFAPKERTVAGHGAFVDGKVEWISVVHTRETVKALEAAYAQALAETAAA